MKIRIKKPKTVSHEIAKIIRAHLRKKGGKGQIEMGATVRQLRLKKGFSGAELCRLSQDLDPRTLTALEKGRIRSPSIGLLKALSGGLGLSISDIFWHAESRLDHRPTLNSPQGDFEVVFGRWGVRVVSFTPFIRDFFCGKLVLGPKKRMNETLLNHPYPICVSVLVGRVEAVVESKPMMLREGASLFFHGSMQFSLVNLLERDAALLFVTAPSFLAR